MEQIKKLKILSDSIKNSFDTSKPRHSKHSSIKIWVFTILYFYDRPTVKMIPPLFLKGGGGGFCILLFTELGGKGDLG